MLRKQAHLEEESSRSRQRRLYIRKKKFMKASFQNLFLSDVHLLKQHEDSGDDAHRGHTRSHPEHDG